MSVTQEKANELGNMATLLHDSLFKKPIDEGTIVKILSNSSSDQRQVIRSCYKRTYGHPIQTDVTKLLSSKFRDICLDLLDSQFEYDARELHRALTSFITDDTAIVEILVSRPKKHLEVVDLVYQKFFQISMKNEIRKKTSKEYTDFLLELLDTVRPTQQTISGDEAYNIAKNINENGIKKYSKDMGLFKSIFLEKSREDLILISRAYHELFQKNLYEMVEKEISGKKRKLMKGILYANITPAEWFANKIYKAMEGIGTDYNSLNRAIIYRSEIDMFAVRDYYLLTKNKDIKSEIEGETSGSYGKILANLSQK